MKDEGIRKVGSDAVDAKSTRMTKLIMNNGMIIFLHTRQRTLSPQSAFTTAGRVPSLRYRGSGDLAPPPWITLKQSKHQKMAANDGPDWRGSA